MVTDVPMSWATTYDRPAAEVLVDQVLDQVGLPAERVDVVARLVGEAEAEEVEGEHGAVGLELEQRAPVEGARREAVQEQQRRVDPVALEDVDPPVAKLLRPPARLPLADPLAQLRRHGGHPSARPPARRRRA